MEFEWDAKKERANVEKHGVVFCRGIDGVRRSA